VTDDAFERITGELTAMLSLALPVDAVYLDLHGAMCSEHYPDAEGELLRRVRAVVGPRVPVVITLDYHVNLTAHVLAHCDAMAIYLTYPHIDRQHTGARRERLFGQASGLAWSRDSLRRATAGGIRPPDPLHPGRILLYHPAPAGNHVFGPLAQLVEHLTFNQVVTALNPATKIQDRQCPKLLVKRT